LPELNVRLLIDPLMSSVTTELELVMTALLLVVGIPEDQLPDILHNPVWPTQLSSVMVKLLAEVALEPGKDNATPRLGRSPARPGAIKATPASWRERCKARLKLGELLWARLWVKAETTGEQALPAVACFPRFIVLKRKFVDCRGDWFRDSPLPDRLHTVRFDAAVV
jgi:hypothetical protein